MKSKLLKIWANSMLVLSFGFAVATIFGLVDIRYCVALMFLEVISVGMRIETVKVLLEIDAMNREQVNEEKRTVALAQSLLTLERMGVKMPEKP